VFPEPLPLKKLFYRVKDKLKYISSLSEKFALTQGVLPIEQYQYVEAKMVGGNGLEPMTSAMSTPNLILKGLTFVNLKKLYKTYLQDRINTKGITESSRATIECHFQMLIRAYPSRFPTSDDLIAFLGTKKPGIRRRAYETYRAFARWLEKRHIMPAPWTDVDKPLVPKSLPPATSLEQVQYLLGYIDSHFDSQSALRNKTIVTLFVESGLRLSELASITYPAIDWQERTIKVWGKGRKEGKAPFGNASEGLLKQWISEYNPKSGDNIWGINRYGIQIMLKRLKITTGIPCNAHCFRRAFACLLRKAGLDSLTIKDLGRWESLVMVQRYTRSVSFQDSLRFYKAPLSQNN
jgi:site-specific recombinase XerC